MADDDSTLPPEMSGTFVLRKTLDELSRPLFDRFAEILAPDEQSLVLTAAARERHASPEAGCDWIRLDLCRRIFPRWASTLNLTEEEARRGLSQVAAQLHGLPDNKPRRVYLALSALDRVALKPSDAFQAACQALGMTRNTVDRNKARALEYARAGTAFAAIPGWDLGEVHLFFLDLGEPLLDAGRKLHLELGSQAGTAAAIEEAHAEANRRRRRYEEKRRAALKLWKIHLPAALDASGWTPLDVEQRFIVVARAAGAPPEEVPSRTRRAWQSLRLCDGIPSRVLPATTWTAVLSRANRPPTFILDGPWRTQLGGAAGEALEAVVRAARDADEAHRAWKDAQERTYQTTRDCPEAVFAAIETFNLSLDGALAAPAKGVAR